MAKKKLSKKTLKKKTGKRSKAPIDQLATPVIESAQDIWRAGLGALAMAQKEGGKVVGQGSALFERLVAEGARFEKQGKAAVDEGAANVRGGISAVAGDLEGKLEAARKQAEDRWESLESVFEQRVLKVVQNLGLATAEDLRRLADQVEQLSGRVASTGEGGERRRSGKTPAATGKGKKTSRRKTASKKTARKKTTRKKTASKKTARKKTASKKTARKKTTRKKTASKKTASKKTRSKTAAGKKAASKKIAGKKSAGKKTTGSKTGRKKAGRKAGGKKATKKST